MKRSTKLALSLVLAVGAAMPAMAQDNFPDAPANHWAYDALAKMKADGLLVGYPDGLYRGSRPASRYELAVAMHAVYSHLKGLIDGLQVQVDALKGINPQDIVNLKEAVAHLQDEINAMKGWGDDIAALKKATEEFDKELRSLGVDVEAMKKDLGDLQSRVTALEKKKPAVDISGDINFFAVTSNGGSGNFQGLNQDGKIEGYSGGANTGLFHDLTFLHEAAFHVAGTNETGPKWQGTFVAGNMLGAGGFGSQSTFAPQTNPYSYNEGTEDVYVQDLSVKFDIKVIGLAFDAEAGRVAYKLSPYMLMRPSTESYFKNERWDDGKYRFDGAILGFNFGPAKIHVWGGNTSNLLSVNGTDLNPLVVANTRVIGGTSEGAVGTNGLGVFGGTPNGILGTIDQTAAADLSIGIGSNGHLSLGYLVLDQNGTGNNTFPPANAPLGDNLLSTGKGNRDSVYGGDANIGFGRIKLSGGYHQSVLTANESPVNSHANEAWDAKLKYDANRLNLWGGYRQIDNQYYAPGDWGRLGIIQNPGNIKGWQAGAYFDLTKALRLTATGEWDKGVSSNTAGYAASPFSSSTNIRQLMARLDLRLTSNFSVYGSIQDVTFSNLDLNSTYFTALTTSNAANYDWTTIGVGYGLSSNAKFNLAYQFSNGFDAFSNPLAANNAGASGFGRFSGGILTSQLTIKF